MKTMGNCKCAHFNEFVSDALSQENNNVVYAASKSRKRAYEAGASQSKAPVMQRAPFRPPASAAKFRPPLKKNPAKTGFRKAFTVALPKGTTSQGSGGIVIRQATGQGNALTLRRIITRVAVKDK